MPGMWKIDEAVPGTSSELVRMSNPGAAHHHLPCKVGSEQILFRRGPLPEAGRSRSWDFACCGSQGRITSRRNKKNAKKEYRDISLYNVIGARDFRGEANNSGHSTGDPPNRHAPGNRVDHSVAAFLEHDLPKETSYRNECLAWSTAQPLVKVVFQHGIM